MMVVGLTGGIGAGKSRVSSLFESLGVPVIDADIVSKQVVKPGSAALKAIAQHFGDSVLDVEGTLNRARLKELIFENPKERLWLEQLLHPLILSEMEHQTQQLKAPYCIHAIPLLVETMPYKNIHRILVVDVSEETQIQRIKHRDHLSEQQIQNIMASQASREKRLSAADDVISNEGSLEELKEAVLRLHEGYLALSGQ